MVFVAVAGLESTLGLTKNYVPSLHYQAFTIKASYQLSDTYKEQAFKMFSHILRHKTRYSQCYINRYVIYECYLNGNTIWKGLNEYYMFMKCKFVFNIHR